VLSIDFICGRLIAVCLMINVVNWNILNRVDTQIFTFCTFLYVQLDKDAFIRAHKPSNSRWVSAIGRGLISESGGPGSIPGRGRSLSL
jgi:hypothetical protein